jgi:uncharacterized protein (TIGR01777 family)
LLLLCYYSNRNQFYDDQGDNEMKYILTGGSGLIGRALAIHLHDAGHTAIILSRNPRVQSRLPEEIQLVKWDGRTSDGWGHLVEEADVVVNLAGENLSSGRWSAKRKRAILESRVNAGTAITQAMQQARKKPHTLVQISGSGAYGTSLDKVYTEDDPYGSDFLSGVTRAWEGSTQPVEALGIRRVILRAGVVLSPHGGAFPRLVLPFKLFVGGPLGSGRQWLAWVHLADAIRAIRFVSEKTQAKGILNLSAEPVTNQQLAAQLGKSMHRPAFLSLPSILLRLVLGEMSMVILEGQRISSQRLIGLGFNFQYPVIESAISDLLHSGSHSVTNLDV